MSVGSAMGKRVAWFAAGAGALVTAFVPMPGAVAWLVGAPALMFGPGAALAAHLAPRGGAALRAAIALSFSPFLVSAPAAALAAAGLPLPAAFRAVLVVVALLAWNEARRPAHDAGGTPAPGAADVAPALGFALLVGALLIANPWLPLRSDGWFHAGVVRQIAVRGLPPEDPYFAGVPLLYFWGVHAWAGSWLAVQTALSPLVPLVAFNVSAAAAVLLAVGAFARSLGADARGVALAAGLTVFGYAPGAWGWIAGRAVTGDVRGFEEISAVVALGADPVMATLARGLLHASLAFFGDKFFVLTPFSMGLALFVLAAHAMVDAAERRPRAALRTGVLIAGALWTHAVIGNALVLLGVVAVVVILGRDPRSSTARRAGLALAAAVGLALLALSPYLHAITAGKQGQLGFRLSREAVTSLVWGAALVAPAAVAWLVGRTRHEPRALVLLAWSALLVSLSLALKLPENNQSKFLNLLLLLLAAPAALGWLALGRRLAAPGRVALVTAGALLALPTAALVVWAFAAERGRSAGSWHEPDAATRAALAWAREHTPATAAFVDLHGAADLVAIAGRSVVWGGPAGERDWGFARDALQSRRLAAQSLALGREPRGQARAMLESLRREIVVTARAADSSDARSGWNVLPGAPGFREIHRTASVAFYRWEGPQ